MNVLSARADYGNERYKKVEFQLKVKEQFDRMIVAENFAVVSAD